MENKVTRGNSSQKFVVEPYLVFNGNCEEAFNFYKSVFGGEFTGMMRYKDIPEGMKISKEFEEQILHIALPIGREVILMGSDGGPRSPISMGENFSLTLSVNDKEEAKRLFKELSTEGKIIMELQKTFWAELHGMLTDKFGINWMVDYP